LSLSVMSEIAAVILFPVMVSPFFFGLFTGLSA